ncbi:MAG: hypothetical protein ACLUSP_04725 [Christensenellales bacterium]
MYAATDYLKKNATVSYFIDVVRSSSPIATFPTLPEMMIAGKKIELPAMKSYDYYSSPAHPVNATVNVYVSETEGVRGEKIDRLYTPAAGSGERTVYFTYETYCAGNEADALTRVYPVVVRDATFLTDYFVKRGVTASGDDGSIGFTATADGAGMKFVHALLAKDFETMFSINSAKNAFTSFTVTFTDSVNPPKNLPFRSSVTTARNVRKFVIAESVTKCTDRSATSIPTRSLFVLIPPRETLRSGRSRDYAAYRVRRRQRIQRLYFGQILRGFRVRRSLRRERNRP